MKLHSRIAILFSIFWSQPGWSAQPAPPASALRFTQIQATGAECERRATLALTSEGYTAASASPGLYYGTKGIHAAYIVCKPGPAETYWATMFVGSNTTDGNLPGREAQTLEKRMSGTVGAANATGCSAAGILGTWNWIGALRITFNPDGTVEDSEGGKGTWKAGTAGAYQVHWLSYGKQTVNFTLSKDGKSTTGGYQLSRKCP
jgi:hypothetical protein